MICVYIEDKKEIREAVLEFYLSNVPIDYNHNQLQVINFPSDEKKLSKSFIRDQISVLIRKSTENEKFVIFTDYGIKTGPRNEDYFYITDIFREIIEKEPDFFEEINEIVIYSYQLGEHLKFYNDIELFKSQYSKHVNIIDFETSLVFNKRVGSRLYNKNLNGLWQIKESLVKHYSVLIAKTLMEFLGLTSSMGVSLLAKSSRDMNRFIYFMNTFYFNKPFKKRTFTGDISDYRLSFISFINPEELDAKYSIDAPYKPYYLEINDYIEEHSLSNIFKNSKGNYFKGLNFIYVRVYKEVLDNVITLNVFYTSTNSSENYLLPQYFRNTKEISAEESFKFWIKATFFQIYHHDVWLDGSFLSIIDYFNNSVKVNLVNQNKAENISLDFTEYIWFFQELEIESFKYKGLLNYGYHREDGGIAQALDIERIKQDVQSLFVQRTPILTSRILDTLYPSFKENIRKQSLLNSLSTVLNRNGSHNLGSHVLATLSNEDLIGQFLKNRRSKTTIYEPHYYRPLNSSKEAINSKKIEYQNTESLIAYFNAYLKNRLDLLAAVGTSGEIVMLNNKPLFASVFKNFERNLILLEHISGKGSDFRYKFCLTIDDEKYSNNIDGLECDVEVSMPNDLLGDQAFYLLLENVIRNTAKHGIYDCTKEYVEFTINVNKKDSNDNFYAIELWDNNSLQQRVNIENRGIEKEEYKKSEITIVAETNERIDKEILRDDFNIREGSWGTIEMKIACCVLSGLPLKNIDDKAYHTDKIITETDKNFPIIKAFEKVISPNKSHLGYQFFIQKPKSVLVIDLDGEFKDKTQTVLNLKEKGIDILSLSNQEFEEKLKSNQIFKHQFIVAFTNKVTNEIEETLINWHNNKQLPNRCLSISDIDLINENLLDACYQIELDKVNPFNENSEKDKYLINVKDDFTYCLPNNYSNNKFLRLKNSGRINFSFREGKFDHHKKTKIDNKIVFCEPYGSITSLGIFLQDWNNSDKKNAIYFSLLEAIKTKVLVIDERVQNALKNKFRLDQDGGSSILFEEIYQATNIVIPPKKYGNIEFNLNKPQDCIENIKWYIEKQIAENKIDFFIFHFGILEKIIPNGKKEDFKEYLNECRGFSKYPIKIVLTSGRGIPSDLPDDEYFCNFSSINYYLTDSNGRSKVHLIRLLQNQRAK